jgi:hypothetical protein
MCQTTSHDGSQNITVKVEEGLEAEVGESEVRFVSVFSLLHISQLLYAHMSVAFLTSLYA